MDRLPLRVYYEDTDAGGVLYHAAAVRYLDRGRAEWLRARGLAPGALAAGHARVFAVRALAVEYLAPGRLDDALTVGTRLRAARPASLRFAQELHRGGACLARAEVTLACLDAASGRPAALPAAIDWGGHA